jgi:hypothetical protein
MYEFFEKRYELEEIKYAAIYDFYSSINYHASSSRVSLENFNYGCFFRLK